MQESLGKAVEGWVREQALAHHLLAQKSFDLGQVVKLLNTKLQRRLIFARMYLDEQIPYANDWVERILSNKSLPQGVSEKAKTDLVYQLLDQALATDLVVAVKDNHGVDCIIAIDVTCDPTKEKSKLNTIQGKREDGDPSKLNRNQNFSAVRKELGINKHLVLVPIHERLPDFELVINELYAAANQPAKTRAVNLRSYTPPAILVDQTSSLGQATLKVQLDPNLTKVLSLIERLPERELANTVQRVQNYFASMPPSPPTQAEQRAVQQEIKELLTEIPTLWQRQERQANIVESMRKDPLRAWNKKHDAALGELQQTMTLIKEVIAQKDYKESQLKEWVQTGKVYQEWVSDPQTKKMQEVAAVLLMPQIQKRINQIRQQAIGQQQQTKLEAKQQHPTRDHKRGQGLGL